MHRAFVLGAGLGTRLRSLTATLPKPLIPFFQRPLITYAFDHLLDLGVRELIVNTHHQAGAYAETFPDSRYHDCPVCFRHEPLLLETAGGIGNVADLLGDAPCIVYNGDILTDLPILPALEIHRASGNLVTLVLRSGGDARHIAWNPGRGKVTDIRNLLGTGDAGGYQFTGIYFVEPAFVRRIEPGVKCSVIPHFLDLIRSDEGLGGVVVDEGHWWDLGDRESYLAAHAAVRGLASFPLYADAGARAACRRDIHADSRISRGASLTRSCAGAGAEVGADAVVTDSILWPGARVAAGARLSRCIVRTGETASGVLVDADI